MEVLYLDNKIIVCVKPAGVLSTDEPGGMPSLLRAALGDDSAPVYTVHRLDAAVSGVMVYARTRHAAADLGRAIERGDVRKEYLAVACGALPEQRGELAICCGATGNCAKRFSPKRPGRTCAKRALPMKCSPLAPGSRSAASVCTRAARTRSVVSLPRAARRSGATQNTAAAGKGISRFFPALSPFRTRSPARC